MFSRPGHILLTAVVAHQEAIQYCSIQNFSNIYLKVHAMYFLFSKLILLLLDLLFLICYETIVYILGYVIIHEPLAQLTYNQVQNTTIHGHC